MAQEFYLVKIGDIYLTDDGMAGGKACLNTVSGLAALFLASNGATVKAVDGSPKNFTLENEGKGINLLTKPFSMKESVLSSLKTLVESSIGGSDIAVEISDGPGAANVDCMALFEGGLPPLNFGPNFFDDNLYDVELRLVTTGFTV